MSVARFLGFAVFIYVLFLFVFAFFATSVDVTKVGYPAVWLRVTDSSFEILAMGFVVDTLIWLTVSLIVSGVIHMIKK